MWINYENNLINLDLVKSIFIADDYFEGGRFKNYLILSYSMQYIYTNRSDKLADFIPLFYNSKEEVEEAYNKFKKRY